MKKKAIMTAGMFTSRTDEWATPAATYAALDAEFRFNLDPCSTHENAKCKRHYTKEDDGLTKDWGGHRVFCNPPYGREIGKWVKKCSEEAKKPETTVVALLPSRTDTGYFHDFIYGKAREIRFVRGRLRFNESKSAAPFPSMIVVF
jgi:site-specific DNA-methyltransferase (adenine-specific)